MTLSAGGCKVEGCPRPLSSRGYCEMHSRRDRQHGDPGPLGRMRRSREQVTADAVTMHEVTDGGCWLWTGRLDGQGYGRIDGRYGLAHRFVYEELVGAIPDGMHLDHLCHTRALSAGACLGGPNCLHRRCVNPEHMEIVTPRENNARMARPTCVRGHDMTDPSNVYLRPDGRGRQCRACIRIRTGWRRKALPLC